MLVAQERKVDEFREYRKIFILANNPTLLESLKADPEIAVAARCAENGNTLIFSDFVPVEELGELRDFCSLFIFDQCAKSGQDQYAAILNCKVLTNGGDAFAFPYSEKFAANPAALFAHAKESILKNLEFVHA